MIAQRSASCGKYSQVCNGPVDFGPFFRFGAVAVPFSEAVAAAAVAAAVTNSSNTFRNCSIALKVPVPVLLMDEILHYPE